MLLLHSVGVVLIILVGLEEIKSRTEPRRTLLQLKQIEFGSGIAVDQSAMDSLTAYGVKYPTVHYLFRASICRSYQSQISTPHQLKTSVSKM
jgi:hypothetical protein